MRSNEERQVGRSIDETLTAAAVFQVQSYHSVIAGRKKQWQPLKEMSEKPIGQDTMGSHQEESSAGIYRLISV